MLENLRDKILNVQHDLSASFRNLATGDTQLTKTKKHKNCRGVSQNAGGSLLHYYQEQWAEIHENDATNASEAEKVDTVIGNLHTFCSDHLSVIKQLNNHLAALPQLQTGIIELMGKIGELEGVFEEVEDALTNLEDVIEIQELQERQLDHRFQLAMYKEKKLSDYEDMKSKLGEEHAYKVLEYEKKQQAVLKERQNTFQEVFEEEIQHYKTHGKLRKRVSSQSSANSVSLEDIELDDDASALDEFLGDDLEKDPDTPEDPDINEVEKNSDKEIKNKCESESTGDEIEDNGNEANKIVNDNSLG